LNKLVKVEFEEQSKAVVTNVKIEYSGDSIPSNDDIRLETQKLFLECQKFSALKTMEKSR
jgi:hypothetical protein